jgi:regulator of sirC expression with transglutaminase-like and TPR domain
MALIAELNPPGLLSDNQKSALIRLLSDDSPAVYQAVREKILSYGQPAIPWLRPHALSSDPALRRRSQEIIRHLSQLRADNRFLAFCLTEGDDLNLEQAVWLLAQTQYPEINVEAYQAMFDGYAAELLELVDLRGDADQILVAFNSYIFDTLRFKGNDENYYDPENNYLNRVVDRRTGNPINLCLIYLMLARRLQLPISGIGLPGHFICRYQTASEEYYIDVFNNGKIWTRADCVQYLLYRNITVQDELLTPVNPRRILMRVCGNLHQIYQHLEMKEHVTRLHRYLIALAK